jgi:hypothetical protein
MMADDGGLSRRAKEITVNDDMLIGHAATEVARALNLEGNNKTLGMKIVRSAADSQSFDEFKEKTLQYGKIKAEVLTGKSIFGNTAPKHVYYCRVVLIFLTSMSLPKIPIEIFHNVTQRFNSVFIQLRDGNSDYEATSGEYSSFGNVERLQSSSEKGGLAVKGGLISKHTFEVPTGTVKKQQSLLGLDKLAALKRVNSGTIRLLPSY